MSYRDMYVYFKNYITAITEMPLAFRNEHNDVLVFTRSNGLLLMKRDREFEIKV